MSSLGGRKLQSVLHTLQEVTAVEAHMSSVVLLSICAVFDTGMGSGDCRS